MHNHTVRLLMSCILLLLVQHSHAATIDELKYALNNNEAPTLIDVRLNSHYKKGHIRNAINIPASIIARKRLPRLGRVIVYGDGIDGHVVEQAVMHLNAKSGITAEVLEGGYSGWSARQAIVGRQYGIDTRYIKNITYQKLQKMTQRGGVLILVDLRVGSDQESLSVHFPNAQIHNSTHNIVRDNIGEIVLTRELVAGIPKDNSHVLILIDDGNGLSEKVANKLHAAGIKRLAILTGGEQALRTKGESVLGTLSGESRD